MNQADADTGESESLRVSRLLIVDDDAAICSLLEAYLNSNGFEVSSLPDGTALLPVVEELQPDLVIMDLMLPGDDGLTLVKKLRTQSQVPVIILSARGDEIDRIVGLEVGADDYLAKPFNPRELLARIRAVLRRNFPDHGEHQVQAETKNEYTFGPFVFQRNTGTLLKAEEDAGLTTGESLLLEIFIDHANRILSRDQLMDLIQGNERMPFDRSIDVRITRLRSKIEEDGRKPVYIRTVWGKGYMFVPTGAD